MSRFYVRFMRDGRYDGNVGPFPTEAAADFFLYASRNGGVPGRTAVVLPILPLCPTCLGSIGGAHGGPDAPYRPAAPGESCGAADHDDGEPDAYDVLNARDAYRVDGRPWPEGGAR